MAADVFWIPSPLVRGVFGALQQLVAACLGENTGQHRQDATNNSGVTDDGELLSLEQAGVNSFTVAYTSSDRTDANGNRHLQLGRFTTADGSTQSMDDVWFSVDTMRTVNLNTVMVGDGARALSEYWRSGVGHHSQARRTGECA